MKRITLISLPMLLLLAVIGDAAAQSQSPSARERVTALNAKLAGSQASLRKYAWIQTTVVSVNGSEKSRKQQRCYYGADGVLQKVDISSSPPPAQKRGLRGKLAAKKAKELADYTKQAVELVGSYVPLDPGRLKAAANAGKVTVQVLQPGKRVRINFADYMKPKDNVAVDVDPALNTPLGMAISSYIGSSKDPVVTVVTMSQLDDGTIYPASITLDAKSKGIQMVVQNSGYLKMKQDSVR